MEVIWTPVRRLAPRVRPASRSLAAFRGRPMGLLKRSWFGSRIAWLRAEDEFAHDYLRAETSRISLISDTGD